jgi:hypothetical protein
MFVILVILELNRHAPSMNFSKERPANNTR